MLFLSCVGHFSLIFTLPFTSSALLAFIIVSCTHCLHQQLAHPDFKLFAGLLPAFGFGPFSLVRFFTQNRLTQTSARCMGLATAGPGRVVSGLNEALHPPGKRAMF